MEEQAELWGKHPSKGEYDADKLRQEIIDRIARHIAGDQGQEQEQDPAEGGAEE